MGDKSPKAKARQKKQELLRQKNEKKTIAVAKVPRPNEGDNAPKAT